MKTRTRVGLLGAFAATGLGMALCIATTTRSVADRRPTAGETPAASASAAPVPSVLPVELASPGREADRITPAGSAALVGVVQDESDAMRRPHPLRFATTDERRDSSGPADSPHRPDGPGVSIRVHYETPAPRNALLGDPRLWRDFPAAQEDPRVLLRSLEEYRGLCRPLDRTATRSYAPRHLTAVELRTLIQPLLSERTGEARLAARIDVGGQALRGPNSAGPVLAVRDSLESLDQLDLIVPLLDTPRPFVTLDAVALRVKLDDSAAAGIDFGLLRQKHLLSPVWRPGAATEAKAFESGPGGLKLACVEGGVGRLIETLSSLGTTAVIAAPRLAVLSGNQADILDQRERLRIRPLVGSDGAVRLEIQAAFPQAAPDGQTDGGLPSASTIAVVFDGATMVLGGMFHEQASAAAAEAPSRHDPLAIFKAKAGPTRRSVERFETIALVSIRTTWGSADPRAVPLESLSPGFRQSIAERYVRFAQGAEVAGDRETAIRLVDQAIRFAPGLKTAIDLRNRMWMTATTEIRIVARPPASGPAVQGNAPSTRPH